MAKCEQNSKSSAHRVVSEVVMSSKALSFHHSGVSYKNGKSVCASRGRSAVSLSICEFQ